MIYKTDYFLQMIDLFMMCSSSLSSNYTTARSNRNGDSSSANISANGRQ